MESLCDRFAGNIDDYCNHVAVPLDNIQSDIIEDNFYEFSLKTCSLLELMEYRADIVSDKEFLEVEKKESSMNHLGKDYDRLVKECDEELAIIDKALMKRPEMN
jgi:hypothetical protein